MVDGGIDDPVIIVGVSTGGDDGCVLMLLLVIFRHSWTCDHRF